MGRILSISSLVTRGRVGNSIAVPVLEALGHEVWSLPTILLSARPGLGTIVRHDIPAQTIASFIDALEADGVLATLDGVLTGYLPSPDHAGAAAQAVQQARAANPALVYLCDPVMGDEGKGLYIDPLAAEVIKVQLVPRADILTPNRFEADWLGANDPGAGHIATTSAGGDADIVRNLLISAVGEEVWEGKRFADVPNGTGDLFAALMLDGALSGASVSAAFTSACARLEAVARASAGADVLDWQPLLSVHVSRS